MKTLNRPCNNSRARGFSILEVLIGSSVMTMVAAASIGILRTGRETFRVGAVDAVAHTRATAILDSVISRLEDCGSSTASIAAVDQNGGPYLTVQRCTGVVNNVVQWGPPLTFGYQLCANASSNKTEGPGELVMDDGAGTTVLGKGLASNGFSVALNGNVATVQITVHREIPGKPPVKVTVERKVQLCNN